MARYRFRLSEKAVQRVTRSGIMEEGKATGGTRRLTGEEDVILGRHAKDFALGRNREHHKMPSQLPPKRWRFKSASANVPAGTPPPQSFRTTPASAAPAQERSSQFIHPTLEKAALPKPARKPRVPARGPLRQTSPTDIRLDSHHEKERFPRPSQDFELGRGLPKPIRPQQPAQKRPLRFSRQMPQYVRPDMVFSGATSAPVSDTSFKQKQTSVSSKAFSPNERARRTRPKLTRPSFRQRLPFDKSVGSVSSKTTTQTQLKVELEDVRQASVSIPHTLLRTGARAFSRTRRQLFNAASQGFSRQADQSENAALQGADRQRTLARKGASWGLRKGLKWNRGHDARVTRHETKKANKMLLRDLKEQHFEKAHGRPAPAKLKRQKWMLRRKQIRSIAEARLGVKNVQILAAIAARVGKSMGAVLRTTITFAVFPIMGALLFFLLLAILAVSLVGILSVTAVIMVSSYLADDAAIHDASIYVTRLEAELEKEIQDIPNSWEWGHIDEFRYDIDPIGHEPLALMAFLTVKYQDFEGYDIPYILRTIHEERYELELHETSEERDSSYTNEDGEEVPDSYTYYILTVTLQSRPLEDIIFAELDADPEGELWEWYDLLMETRGNHQAYANPFDFDWLPRRTSLYGWRIDPVAGRNLQTHRGLDIAAPTGTPIRAGLNGTVLVAVHEDAIFGNFLIIGDEQGRELKYAHCDRLLVRRGEQVVAGQTIIGVVGNTGASTGPHLHIEVKEQGEYRNPMYMIGFETEEPT